MTEPEVVVVGGGLAGLAAAAGLVGRGVRVSLWEAKRKLGGRAASFYDAATESWIDHCQHVSMGCCTNLSALARMAGLESAFHTERELLFIGPQGERCGFAADGWLPAPLHLGRSFLGLSYLSWRDRTAAVQALWKLLRLPSGDPALQRTVADWLCEQRQSAPACENFWKVILVSALSEGLDRIALSAARKVFADGFVRHAKAYEVQFPRIPLHELYDKRLSDWLTGQGVSIHRGRRLKRLSRDPDREGFRLESADGAGDSPAKVVLAAPWFAAAELLDAGLRAALPEAVAAASWPSAAITSVHLWYAEDWLPVPHAVLVGRTSQWIFKKLAPEPGPSETPSGSIASRPKEFHYQIVVSNSRDRCTAVGEALETEVLQDLAACFPQSHGKKPLRTRAVAEKQAVFSPLPEVERARPSQRTAVPGLYLAGDWTATGWPATMEGAVRSGFLAAEALLADLGRPAKLLAPDLPPGLLARALFRWPAPTD